jgi:hypothetical protein
VSQATSQATTRSDVDGRIRVPCPRCTLPVALTMPEIVFPGDAERALLKVARGLRLHVAYGCAYS